MKKQKTHNEKHKNKKYVGVAPLGDPQKRNTQRGITLIALIITIIVLLILAVVSIRLVMNNGILGKAEHATSEYGTAEEQEQIKLGYAEYQMAQASGEANPTLTVAGATVTGDATTGWSVEFSKTGNVYTLSADGQTITTMSESEKGWLKAETITDAKINTVLNATENTKLKDEYGNKIVVPAGFKIKKDADTNNATHVTEGIVVTDGTNEFVWIPVGNIKTSTTDTTGTQITLGRYGVYNSNTSKWEGFEVGATPVQTIANYSEQVKINASHTEDTSTNHNSGYGNTIAKDIYAFLSSAESNGGYYLGRYEARTETERTAKTDPLTTLTENKNDYVYIYVTQSEASERCQGMYTNKPFTSDLVNSYAWDTAIMFIENFSNNSSYGSKMSVNSNYSNKGTSTDKISNIYDLASNCIEWSTETYGSTVGPCTHRGGFYGFRGGDFRACGRDNDGTTDSNKSHSFRPLLYV